jgi:hypothetical protein
VRAVRGDQPGHGPADLGGAGESAGSAIACQGSQTNDIGSTKGLNDCTQGSCNATQLTEVQRRKSHLPTVQPPKGPPAHIIICSAESG